MLLSVYPRRAVPPPWLRFPPDILKARWYTRRSRFLDQEDDSSVESNPSCRIQATDRCVPVWRQPKQILYGSASSAAFSSGEGGSTNGQQIHWKPALSVRPREESQYSNQVPIEITVCGPFRSYDLSFQGDCVQRRRKDTSANGYKGCEYNAHRTSSHEEPHWVFAWSQRTDGVELFSRSREIRTVPEAHLRD